MAADKTDQSLSDFLRSTVDEGTTATLVTILKSDRLTTGAKLVIRANGQTCGDLGDAALNEAAAINTGKFLLTREAARSVTAAEFAPDQESLRHTQLLFERIEAEPRLIIA